MPQEQLYFLRSHMSPKILKKCPQLDCWEHHCWSIGPGAPAGSGTSTLSAIPLCPDNPQERLLPREGVLTILTVRIKNLCVTNVRRYELSNLLSFGGRDSAQRNPLSGRSPLEEAVRQTGLPAFHNPEGTAFSSSDWPDKGFHRAVPLLPMESKFDNSYCQLSATHKFFILAVKVVQIHRHRII